MNLSENLILILSIIGGAFIGWHGIHLIYKSFCIYRVFKKQWKRIERLDYFCVHTDVRISGTYESWKILDTKSKENEQKLLKLDERVSLLEKKKSK